MREFRSLVDLASDAAMAIDRGLHVVGWNERAERLLGYAANEALGQCCWNILQAVLPSGEPLCKPECDGNRCFERHMPFSVPDCQVRHRNGQWQRATISSLVAPAARNSSLAPPTAAVVLLRPHEGAASVAPTDGRLRVFTFGQFALSANGQNFSTDRWHRRHALTLLKILVTGRHAARHREYLIEQLWPDANERRGRERLKVTTYFLRKKLRGVGMNSDVVAVIGSSYTLNNRAVWLDCEAFENLYNEGRSLAQRDQPEKALVAFEKAVRLYRGDYLPEDLYAEWCAEERERLREMYFDVLGHVIDGRIEGGDFEEAAVVCRRGLVHEPCRESFHRGLMLCLARLGQRDRLVAHYDHCRKLLETELGVDPTPQTERLYQELIASSGASTARAKARH